MKKLTAYLETMLNWMKLLDYVFSAFCGVRKLPGVTTNKKTQDLARELGGLKPN